LWAFFILWAGDLGPLPIPSDFNLSFQIGIFIPAGFKLKQLCPFWYTGEFGSFSPCYSDANVGLHAFE
jgi:hypothetical protein